MLRSYFGCYVLCSSPPVSAQQPQDRWIQPSSLRVLSNVRYKNSRHAYTHAGITSSNGHYERTTCKRKQHSSTHSKIQQHKRLARTR
jgi:hypothetical protein